MCPVVSHHSGSGSAFIEQRYVSTAGGVCAGAGQEEASEPGSAQRGADLDKAQTGVQNQPGPAQRWQLGSHQAHHQICTAHLL